MQQKPKLTSKDYSEVEIANASEYVRYAIDIERANHELQNQLVNCNSPQEVALAIMQTIAGFYEADWCGILDVDVDLGMWNICWWYSRELGAMAPTEYNVFELRDNYQSWILSLRNKQPMVITDIESIKKAFPKEYDWYRELGVFAVIGVPFWMNSAGFVVVKNPRKHQEHYGFLRMLSYGIITSLNEYRLAETTRHSHISSRISNETDVYINLFGELKITTAKGVLTESELKSPKLVKMLAYFLLTKKTTTTPREIADVIWPEDDMELPVRNMKTLVYRLQQAFSVVSDYRLVESTTNGYQLNPKLRIVTDIQLFDYKWNSAMATLLLEDKQEILKKMVNLYSGEVLKSANTEHWLMAIATKYQNRYLGAVNELLKTLDQEKHYHHIHQYAVQALTVAPHSSDIYYWLIHAMRKQGYDEMARSELWTAKDKLLEEEFAELKEKIDSDKN